MRMARGCGWAVLFLLFVVVACLVFVSLTAGMFLTGELPLYAPRLTGLQPDPNDAFLPLTPIKLTFDQPMDTASVEAAFQLEPDVPGTFEWSEDLSQLTFVPQAAGFEPGTTYSARLDAGAQAGTFPRALPRTVAWSFSLPPLLDTQEPLPGARDLGPRTALTATFHYPLNCAATFRTFSIVPDTVGLLGCKDGALGFESSRELDAGTGYVAQFGHVFLEGDPTPRPGVRWEFHTASALSVEEILPEAPGFILDLRTPFTVTFNRPVDPESAASRFYLLPRGGVAVAGEFSWREDGASLVFQPEQPLEPAMLYELTVAAGVRDALGFALDARQQRIYSTAPMMGIPLPIPGSEGVGLDSRIRVPFTRPMDRASVEAGLAVSPAVEGNFMWDEDTLVFIPQGGLAPDTSYQVLVPADIRDATGAPLARPRQWVFTTGPFLVEVVKPSEEIVTELQQAVEFTFALSMDRTSVGAALTISPTTPGDLVWSADSRTVAFQPEPAWRSGTEYEISLAGSARTADGFQTLGEDVGYAFETGVSTVRFGRGPNVQVMAAGGERAFQVLAQGADVADFRLYEITPTQFVELYGPASPGDAPLSPRALATENLTPTVSWREPLARLGSSESVEWQPAEAHVPADVPPGLYVLSAEPPPEQESQLLVVLTNHVLLLKRAQEGSGDRAEAQIVAWDSSIGDGGGVVSATVRLYDPDASLVAEGTTNEKGLLTVSVPGDPGPWLALSETDGDVTVTALEPDWSERDGQLADSPLGQAEYLIHAVTDRPIYQPSGKVHFKQFVRADDDARYALPAPDLPITVRLRDGRDNVAASQVVTATEFGTADGVFQLTDQPMMGPWRLETEVEGVLSRTLIEVEQERTQQLEVRLRVPQEAYVEGQVVSVTVEAIDALGQPVVDGEVALEVHAIYPDEFERDGSVRSSYLLSRVGKTDAQGQWTGYVPTEGHSDLDPPQDRTGLVLEVMVMAETGQSGGETQMVMVRRTSQDLSLVLDKTVFLPNEAVTFTATVRARDGVPEPGVPLVAQAVGPDETDFATASGTTDDDGQVRPAFTLGEQGWYWIRVTGVDEGGRLLEAGEKAWILDPTGQASWYEAQRSEEPRLLAVLDRPRYAVGQEAQLWVYTPVSGPALVSFERGRTHQSEMVTLVSGTNLISVPVRAEYAPNVEVTVNQFGVSEGGQEVNETQPDLELYIARTQLQVLMEDKLLTVALRSDQEIYGPGEEAVLHIQVKDDQGEPVVAEVNLVLAEEASYALLEDSIPGLFDVFYGPRPNSVRTYDSMRPTRWLDPNEPRPEGLPAGEGDREGTVLSRAFAAGGYWVPAVVTDELGEAEIKIQLPDRQTEWIAVARAITTDTMVGEASAEFMVGQSIVLRPALPPFLVSGDTISVTASVYNSSTQPVSVTIQIEAEGLKVLSDESQLLNLPAGRTVAALWPAVADDAGEARILLRATASRGTRLVGRAASEVSAQVHPLAFSEATTWAGELTASNPTAAISFTLPADAIEPESGVEVRLAPSLTPSLLEGLEYAIDYPYGCVEQTMSRVLPAAALAQALREFGARDQFIEADLPAVVELGLQKLYGYQHDDGGWGWWYDDSSDAHQTAYVLMGMAMTSQAGFDIDSGVMARGAEALRDMLPQADPRAEAFAAFALAIAGQPLSITLTLSDALALDPFSMAALAIALDLRGSDSVSADLSGAAVPALLSSLRESVIEDDTTAHWEAQGEEAVYSRSVMGSPVRTTAMVVETLVRLEPGSAQLPKAVRWLMEQRDAAGWGDTQRTSYAILALTDYARANQLEPVVSRFQVVLNGELWREGAFGSPQEGEVITVPHSALGVGENALVVGLGSQEAPSPGRLYYGVTVTSKRAPLEGAIAAVEAGEQSIGVQREYRLYGSQELTSEFQPGDMVEVLLTLDVPEESWYVVIEDPLPAGLMAISERLGTATHSAEGDEEPIFYWDRYGYNRKIIREDRVSIFVRHLEAGSHSFTYLVQALAPGSYTALPVQVYPMYEPAKWSRASSTGCQVEAQ